MDEARKTQPKTAIRARREANRIMDQLEPLTDADWAVIRLAQREYVSESA